MSEFLNLFNEITDKEHLHLLIKYSHKSGWTIMVHKHIEVADTAILMINDKDADYVFCSAYKQLRDYIRKSC